MVLDTPIPQLELAIEGKLEFVRQTNPFRAGKGRKGRDKQAAPEPRDKPPSKQERTDVAGQLRAIFGGAAAKTGGLKKKPQK